MNMLEMPSQNAIATAYTVGEQQIPRRAQLFEQYILEPLARANESGRGEEGSLGKLIEEAGQIEGNGFAKILAQTKAWDKLLAEAKKALAGGKGMPGDLGHIQMLERMVHEELNKPLEVLDGEELKRDLFDVARSRFTQVVIEDPPKSQERLDQCWMQAIGWVKKDLGISPQDELIGSKLVYKFQLDPSDEEKGWYQDLLADFTSAQVARFFRGNVIKVSQDYYDRRESWISSKEIRAGEQYQAEEQLYNIAVMTSAVEVLKTSLRNGLTGEWSKDFSTMNQAHLAFTSRVFEGFENRNDEIRKAIMSGESNRPHPTDDRSYLLGMAIREYCRSGGESPGEISERAAELPPEYIGMLTQVAEVARKFLPLKK